MTNLQAQDMRYNVYNRGVGSGALLSGVSAVSATDAVVAGGTL